MPDHFPLPRRSLVMIWWNCKQRSTCWIGKEQKMVWDTSLWFTRSRVSWLEFWRYKWWEYWLLNWEADDYIHTFEFWMRKVRLRWNMKHQQKLYKNWFSSTSSWLDYASVLLGGGGVLKPAGPDVLLGWGCKIQRFDIWRCKVCIETPLFPILYKIEGWESFGIATFDLQGLKQAFEEKFLQHLLLIFIRFQIRFGGVVWKS